MQIHLHNFIELDPGCYNIDKEVMQSPPYIMLSWNGKCRTQKLKGTAHEKTAFIT